MLTLFFKYIKNQSFINIVFSLVFLKKIDQKMINLIKNFPPPPQNYFNDWSQKKNYYSTSFSFCNSMLNLDISTNFSKSFIKSLMYRLNSPYLEVNSIVKKYEKEAEDENLYENLLEDLLQKLQNSELSIMKQYHKNLSIATGINVGLLCDVIEEKNFFKRMDKFFIKIKVIQYFKH